MPFQDISGICRQRLGKVHIKLHHQVSSLLGVFGERETLSGYSFSHAGLDDVRDLHVARLPVYRRHGDGASAQRLWRQEYEGKVRIGGRTATHTLTTAKTAEITQQSAHRLCRCIIYGSFYHYFIIIIKGFLFLCPTFSFLLTLFYRFDPCAFVLLCSVVFPPCLLCDCVHPFLITLPCLCVFNPCVSFGWISTVSGFILFAHLICFSCYQCQQ